VRLIVSAEAEADLRAIIRFTTLEWGIERAGSYARGLGERLQLLREHPELGPPADEISPGLRRYPYLSHNAFYRIGKDEVRIVRILHKRMGSGRHLP
jgi:toxin ParE1/3/4